jgi:hypothetical protein
MQRRLLIFILIGLGLVQVSCQISNRESILLIAVDDLVVTDVNCLSEGPVENKSGLDVLCKESVRFTHAFSPSTMASPALASLMTGLFPFQHGVRNNGQFLSATLPTAAKSAVARSYRTVFFSGGAPILRKTGLNLGFEVFEDNFAPGLSAIFRSFGRSSALFKQWLKQEAGGAPFFATIYAPDLIFTNTETVSDMGEPRNLTFESQLDEFNEALYDLFDYLKKNNRWDHTTVILAGLNGHTNSDRPNESSVLNLHSESTQIALLIKPSQRKRDEGITWKIDKNVSLVDVGRTLFDILDSTAAPPSEDFPAESLSDLLKHPETDLQEDRPIVLESGWGFWKGLSNIRSAVVKSHILFINDAKLGVYNTLVDRMETNPLPVTDSFAFSPHSILEALQKNNFSPWTGIPAATAAKLNLTYQRWNRPSQDKSLLRDLKKIFNKFPEDREIQNWTAEVALEQKDWTSLKQVGTRAGNDFWSYVADKNTGTVKNRFSNPCLALLRVKSFDVDMLRSCNDPLMLEFVDWIRNEARGLSRETQRKKFERSYRAHRIDLNIHRSNIGAGMIWDINKNTDYAPGQIDLVLSLPEFQHVRGQLEKSIRIANPTDE